MENKIKITNMLDHEFGLANNTTNFYRAIPPKGYITLDKNIFEEMIYLPGINYALQEGMIYIEDMEFKKEVGLEPEDVKEPTNIVPLTDALKKAMLTTYTLDNFKKKLATLSKTQINSLVDYALDNNLIDYAKSEVLKKVSGRDIIKTIELNKEDTTEE